MGGKGSGNWARPLMPCGTVAAYQRHRKKGEECSVCKAASRLNARSKYVRKKSSITRIKGRIAIIEEKLRRGACMDCQMQVTRENYVCFDFDHRDPALKSFAISSKWKHVSEALLQAEFAKCDVVCSNCHRLRTHVQIKTGVLTGKKATYEKVQIAPTLFDIAN